MGQNFYHLQKKFDTFRLFGNVKNRIKFSSSERIGNLRYLFLQLCNIAELNFWILCQNRKNWFRQILILQQLMYLRQQVMYAPLLLRLHIRFYIKNNES